MSDWTPKDFSIFVQSLMRNWIGPEDDSATVRRKMETMYFLAVLDLPRMASQKPPTMSKQKQGRYVNLMEKAIQEDDHGAIWELYRELEEDEVWDELTSTMDRWRVQRWKKAIYTAGKTFQETPDPRFIPPLDI